MPVTLPDITGRRRALLPVLAAVLAGAPVAHPQATPPATGGGAAGSELLAAADELRRGSCTPPPGARVPLRRREALDRAARAFADGLALGEALQRAGYVATESAGLRIEGARDRTALRGILAQRFCSRLASGALSEAGAWHRGARGWLIVATPPLPATAAGGVRASLVSGGPAPEPERGVREVLALVNAARSEPRRCGDRLFAASPPLEPSTLLARVARDHADDMAQRVYFDHTGANDSSPPERIGRGGYDWTIAGENLALGRMTAREAVDGWLASPGHCANIMEPRFTETGVALATGRERDRPTYWVQTFAAPKLR